MKRASFLAAAAASVCTSTGPAFASQPRIAIGIESADNTLNVTEMQRLLDGLTGQFLSSHRFQVVDRERLAAVIAEQGFSNSPYADPQTAAALGRIVGASRILHVVVSLELDNNEGSLVSTREATVSASFQLVGVDTARIVSAGTAEGTAQSRTGSAMSDSRLVNEAIDDCAQDLAAQIESAR